MKRNMREWVNDLIKADYTKPLPVLSAPGAQLVGVGMGELISDADIQADCMIAVANRVDMAAVCSLMDLSVEAECFGATIKVNDNGVPDVVDIVVSEIEDAEKLQVPPIGSGRTGIFLEACGKVCSEVSDRPVFAGVIGPYSLVGRLMGITDAMMNCYDEPEMVHLTLKKCNEFIISLIRAYKEAGADGVLLAEPLSGMLSPSLAGEFSHPYVKEIIDAVQDDHFAVIYHDCGNNVPLMKKDIYNLGAMGYHFGDIIDLDVMLQDAPENALVMGNISPAEEFLNGTPCSMKMAVEKLMAKCGTYQNFIISSGCDIPDQSPWRNIDAFFTAYNEIKGV